MALKLALLSPLLLLLLLLLAGSQELEGRMRPVARLPEAGGGGSLRGLYMTSANGLRYAAFLGVPFAQPPVGELRFHAPEPHPGWSGVRDATEMSPVCPELERDDNSVRGQEDCLYLDVFAPAPFKKLSGASRPVMVSICGGSFFECWAKNEAYGMDYLMDADVVVVAINYRVSLFGFLTTDDAAAPGNFGLLDQVMAIRWVRDNIAAFGGDPQRVTLFGESAGGASVSLHMASPLSRGLFHRAISQSGPATARWVVSGPQRNLADWYAQQVNCPTADSWEMVECMRQVPTETFMELQQLLGTSVTFYGEYFLPRIDKEASTSSPFLPKHPREMFASGDFNRVPWIIGVNANEGIISYNPETDDYMRSYVEWIISGDDDTAWLGYVGHTKLADPTEASAVSGQLRDFYQRVSGELTVQDITALDDLYGDFHVYFSSGEMADLACRYAPVYRYFLDHRGPGQMSWKYLLGEEELIGDGVAHGDDLAYMFKGVNQTLAPTDSEEYRMIRLVVGLWTNFARLGYPTTDPAASFDWPVYESQGRQYLRLNLDHSVATDLLEERMTFWAEMMDKFVLDSPPTPTQSVNSS